MVISGVVLLYAPESIASSTRALRHDDVRDAVTHGEAADVVRREVRGFEPADVVDSHGVYLVYGTDYERQAYSTPVPGGCSAPTTPQTG